MATHDLQTDGQTVVRETAGDRNPRDARQVGGQGENIRQIHGQRIVKGFADGVCRCGRHRGDNRIAGCKCRLKIVLDQRANLGSLAVVCIVVTGGQGIGTQDNATLHFRTESL